MSRNSHNIGLCHGVFTHRFIFRYILGQFLPRKWKLCSVFDRIRHVCGSMGSISYAMISRGMPWISHSELEFSLNTTHSPKAIQTLLKARVYTEKPGAHNPDRATSILYLAAYVTAFLRTSLIFLDTF